MKPFLRWVIGILVAALILAIIWFISQQRAYQNIRATAREEVKALFDSLTVRRFFSGQMTIGPFSAAVRQGDFLFISGQIALLADSLTLLRGSIEQETRQVMENLGGALRNAGYEYRDVISTTIFLKDLNDYEKINAVYAAYFQEGSYPARTVVEVSRMPMNARVSISAIAFKEHK